MKYIGRHKTLEEYIADNNKSDETYISWISDGTEYGKISYCVDGEPTVYNENGKEIIDLTNYLCFTALQDNSTIALNNEDNDYRPVIYYSLDNKQTWTKWNYSLIMLDEGESVYMYGDNPEKFCYGADVYWSTFVMTGKIAASGNILSLISKSCPNSIPCEGYFYNLFYNCTSLTQASALPATTLATYCYGYMFSGCTSLTQAPALPATALKYSCYYSMFDGCTSLTQAPELPATTLANYCYGYMFYGCTSLTQAPELPATTLANYCYQYMFYNCTSLTHAPELPATTLVDSCYYGMFCRCTHLEEAPKLPATTLANYCYQYMFYNCANLSYVKCLAINNVDILNLSNWLSGVKSSGTFIKAPSATYSTGASGIPEGWTIENI